MNPVAVEQLELPFKREHERVRIPEKIQTDSRGERAPTEPAFTISGLNMQERLPLEQAAELPRAILPKCGASLSLPRTTIS
jgi:hypothetical protein